MFFILVLILKNVTNCTYVKQINLLDTFVIILLIFLTKLHVTFTHRDGGRGVERGQMPPLNPSRTSEIFFVIVTRFQAFRLRLHEKGKEEDDKDDTFIKLPV